MKVRSLTAALLLTLSSGPALAQAEPPRAPRMPPRRAPPVSPRATGHVHGRPPLPTPS